MNYPLSQHVTFQKADPITVDDIRPGQVLHLDGAVLMDEGWKRFSLSDEYFANGQRPWVCLSVQEKVSLWVPLYGRQNNRSGTIGSHQKKGHPNFVQAPSYYHTANYVLFDTETVIRGLAFPGQKRSTLLMNVVTDPDAILASLSGMPLARAPEPAPAPVPVPVLTMPATASAAAAIPPGRPVIGRSGKPYGSVLERVRPFLNALLAGETAVRQVADALDINKGRISQILRDERERRGIPKVQTAMERLGPYFDDLLAKKITQTAVAAKLGVSVPTVSQCVRQERRRRKNPNRRVRPVEPVQEAPQPAPEHASVPAPAVASPGAQVAPVDVAVSVSLEALPFMVGKAIEILAGYPTSPSPVLDLQRAAELLRREADRRAQP